MSVSVITEEVSQEIAVAQCMSTDLLTIGPSHTLRDAAKMMTGRQVGAAVVTDPDAPGLGLITERDILKAVALNHDRDAELVGEHMSDDRIFATPEYTLQEAAEQMVANDLRYLLVVDNGELVGILSMRDIVRCETNGARHMIHPSK